MRPRAAGTRTRGITNVRDCGDSCGHRLLDRPAGTAAPARCHTTVRLLILLALWPALARAQTIDEAIPPAIRIEPAAASYCRVVIDRAKLDIAGAPISWLVIEASSKGQCQSAELLIDVPAKAGVAGMAVNSRGDKSWSAPREVHEARRAFDREAGAALLVWESSTADQDHLRVSIPLPARVEIAILLPLIEKVVVEATGHPSKTIDLRDAEVRLHSNTRFANAKTAFVTGAPNRDEPIQTSGRWTPTPEGWAGKKSIRRTMKLSSEKLRYCYERVAQWRGEIEGTATLQFFINARGVVESVQTAETDLPPAITTCLEDVVKDWHFNAVDGPVLVNYPLRFSTPKY